MKRWDVINRFAKKHGYTRYLEIGLSTGKNFTRVDCAEKESVDPAIDRYEHANPTYRMTSDEFFATVADAGKKTYDIIFIDGLHESAQVDRDIAGALQAAPSCCMTATHGTKRARWCRGFRPPGTAMSGKAL